MTDGRPKPFWRLLAGGVAVAAMTALYLVFHLRTHNTEDLRGATEDLLHGATHWVTFQNRILGPMLIAAFRAITGWSWMRTFYILVASCLATGAFSLIWRAWRQEGDLAKGLGGAAGWFLLAFIFNHAWSYPWDYLGALLNLFLVMWAHTAFRTLADLKSVRLVCLILALMLNRESSLLALAALFCTVVLASRKTGKGVIAWPWLLWLTAAGAANLAIVVGLRRTLFQHSTRPSTVNTLNETTAGNFLQLGDNWRLISTPADTVVVRGMAAAILALIGVFLVNSAATIWRAAREPGRCDPGTIFPHLYLCFAVVAIAVFADVSEPRVYFELIPLCVMLGPELGRREVACSSTPP